MSAAHPLSNEQYIATLSQADLIAGEKRATLSTQFRGTPETGVFLFTNPDTHNDFFVFRKTYVQQSGTGVGHNNLVTPRLGGDAQIVNAPSIFDSTRFGGAPFDPMAPAKNRQSQLVISSYGPKSFGETAKNDDSGAFKFKEDALPVLAIAALPFLAAGVTAYAGGAGAAAGATEGGVGVSEGVSITADSAVAADSAASTGLLGADIPAYTAAQNAAALTADTSAASAGLGGGSVSLWDDVGDAFGQFGGKLGDAAIKAGVNVGEAYANKVLGIRNAPPANTNNNQANNARGSYPGQLDQLGWLKLAQNAGPITDYGPDGVRGYQKPSGFNASNVALIGLAVFAVLLLVVRR